MKLWVLHIGRHLCCFCVCLLRYCEARRKALLDHVYEGYETDIWEYIPYDWSCRFLKIKDNVTLGYVKESTGANCSLMCSLRSTSYLQILSHRKLSRNVHNSTNLPRACALEWIQPVTFVFMACVPDIRNILKWLETCSDLSVEVVNGKVTCGKLTGTTAVLDVQWNSWKANMIALKEPGLLAEVERNSPCYWSVSVTVCFFKRCGYVWSFVCVEAVLLY